MTIERPFEVVTFAILEGKARNLRAGDLKLTAGARRAELRNKRAAFIFIWPRTLLCCTPTIAIETSFAARRILVLCSISASKLSRHFVLQLARNHAFSAYSLLFTLLAAFRPHQPWQPSLVGRGRACTAASQRCNLRGVSAVLPPCFLARLAALNMVSERTRTHA